MPNYFFFRTDNITNGASIIVPIIMAMVLSDMAIITIINNTKLRAISLIRYPAYIREPTIITSNPVRDANSFSGNMG